MNSYSKYEPSTSRPKRTDYMTVYYYKNGKVVGERKVVDGKTVYYELLGARREVSGVEKLDFNVSEKVVDDDGFKTANNEFNTSRSRGIQMFIDDMMKEYNLSMGEVQYFLDGSDSFRETEDKLDEFTTYRSRY